MSAELTRAERDELIRAAREVDPKFATQVGTVRGPVTEPGKYEGNADGELVVALDILTNAGYADDTNGDVEHNGHGARFGRAILVTDSQGFVSVAIFESEQAAIAALDELDPPGDDGEGVTFGELRPTGEVANVQVVDRAAILACPHTILMPSHYREGRCRCFDPTHAEMREWGYTWNGERWA